MKQPGWPDDVTFVAEVFHDWTTLELPDGGCFAFSRESGKVYKLPHPDAPFVPYLRRSA